MNNGYITAEELLSLSGKRLYRDVVVNNPFDPSRPLKFRLQSLTEAEWSAVSSGNYDTKKGGLDLNGLQQSDARLVAASLVDGDGALLLPMSDATQRVANLGAPIVEPLVREARDLNNLGKGEESGKNSPAEQDLDTNSQELPVTLVSSV